MKLTSPLLNAAFSLLAALLVVWLAVMFLTHPPQNLGPQKVIMTGGDAEFRKKSSDSWVTARLPDGREGRLSGFGVMRIGEEVCVHANTNWGGWSITLRVLPESDCIATK